jgi:adenine C2-methylase RlmN of 23S rRNA A2503 and tRNA A37
MQKYSIHNEEKVKEIMKENKFQPFRYKQIENAIYKNFITDFDKIETIPKDLRKLLKDNFFYSTLTIDTQVTSKNKQTTKTLYKTQT